jgi:hypothetical protein
MEKMLRKVIERFKPAVVAAVWEHFSKDFADACHAAGALVFVDEDNSESWAPALEWGADGIQTDDPEGLIAFLRARAATP